MRSYSLGMYYKTSNSVKNNRILKNVTNQAEMYFQV